MERQLVPKEISCDEQRENEEHATMKDIEKGRTIFWNVYLMNVVKNFVGDAVECTWAPLNALQKEKKRIFSNNGQ